jgi:hypothetical protein
MKTIQDEMKPAEVPARATQVGETNPREWEWVERHVWTERMLEALVKGVKGGVWFSLIGYDHFRWPNAFFRAHGLFSLVEAHKASVQSSLR